jgi:cytochrome c-type biogenesis protein CcmE
MGQASKVVAVGTMREGEFHSRKLLLKCPSKYESTKSGA